MIDVEYHIAEIKKYLNRARTHIERQATFNFMGKSYVEKSRIDDVLCCLEASFPDRYKELLKNSRAKSFPSYKFYRNLCMLVRQKSKNPLFANCYVIKVADFIGAAETFVKSLRADFNSLENS